MDSDGWRRRSSLDSNGLFGEVVSAKKFERMVAEIELKVWVYTLMMNLPPALALSAVRS